MWLLHVLLYSVFVALSRASQPDAVLPVPAPLRELPWAQLNILHTTDIHGWLGGHLQETSFSADWGDYHSFTEHTRKKADDEGVDLLLVDTGDRVEGNGLYDGSDPKGEYYFNILSKQHIDLICSGNHELYLQNSSENEFYKTVPAFKDNYISSNLDIINPETGKQEPLAKRFKKFTTKNQGIRIMAFGFLFNFAGNAKNTVVQPVEETVKTKWFQEAIRDRDIDLIIVFGHVAIRSTEYDVIYKAIRAELWDMPIAFLGGHAHVRDYKVFEKKAVALASGRYFETVGFLSIAGLTTGSKDKVHTNAAHAASSVKFSRRYIDNNLFSLQHHANKDSGSFPTKAGLEVSQMITAARKELRLSSRLGCAPQTLWLNRAPYKSNASLFTWLEESVLPDQLSASPRISKEGKKALVITNTGAMRFDILKGPFTRDSEYLVSPFVSGFRYLANVPFKTASRVILLLNAPGPMLDDVKPGPRSLNLESNTLSLPEYQDRYVLNAKISGGAPHNQIPIDMDGGKLPFFPFPAEEDDRPDLIPGYTTSDDLGSDGDDTIHTKIDFYNVPNCIQAAVGFSLGDDKEQPETVDLVFNEFIQNFVLLSLKYLGENYDVKDTATYLDGKSFTAVLRDWVEANWHSDAQVCPGY